MNETSQVSRCFIHKGKFNPDCEGSYITRRSIHGAVTRCCLKAWTVPFKTYNDVRIQIDLKGWPEVVREEF